MNTDVDVDVQPEPPRRRRRGLLAGGVVVAAAVVAVAVLATRSSDNGQPERVGTARARVAKALGATIDAGNFHQRYTLSVAPGGYATVTGTGTTSLRPFGVVSVADLGGLHVTVRYDTERLWEYGGADYGRAPQGGGTDPGGPISGMRGLAAGTLGPKGGPLSLLGLASSTGYLGLVEQEIQSADEAGTDTVDGVPVTVYELTVDLHALLKLPDLSDEQRKTLEEALQDIDMQGLASVRERVAVDHDGFIRRTTRTSTFNDGTVVTNDSVLFDFGCAGDVLMPNATSTTSTTAPAHCG